MMGKRVDIVYSADEWDCETCGGSYCDSYQIRCEGLAYGEMANAHCLSTSSTDLAPVLLEFLRAEGYDVRMIHALYKQEEVEVDQP
jgi:hypothetical protein